MFVHDSRASFDIVPWSPSFETSVEIIDQQHRQLVKLLNSLAQQYVYGLEPDQLKDIVDGLVDYTSYHFQTEERLWKEVFGDDEWFAKHHLSHDGFVEKIRSMQALVAQNASLSGVDELLSFLVSWLAHHILHDDKSMSIVLLEVRKGQTLADAKAKSLEAMSGQVSGLIQSVLSMYKQLSGRTLALQREAYAREVAEQKLRDQEEHWKSVLGATNDSLWDWNLEALDADDSASTLHLFAQEGQTIHPGDWSGLRVDFLEHLLGNTEVFSHQHRVIDGDGQERWVQSRGKVIAHDSEGRPSRIVGTQTDITERKNQELILQRERDTRLLISEFASDFMASSPEEFDAAIERALLRAGKYMGADRTYVFLVSEDGQYMSNTHEWCAPGINPEIDNLQNIPINLTPWWWQQLRTTGYLLIPKVSEMPPEAHAEYAILDAQHIRSVCVYPLHMDGDVIGFLGNDAVDKEQRWGPEVLQFLELMSDLLGIALEHRQVQKQRERAINRLERAEQQAHLGHWSYNLDSGEIHWSPEVSRIFELDTVLSIPTYDAYLDMVHPEDRQKAHDTFQKAKSHAGFMQTEHRVFVAPDRIKYLEVRGQFETGPEGTPASVEGTIQDVSERSRYREELRRLAYEDALTGLANRRSLVDTLRREINYCDKHGNGLVLALLDLDNFRATNERYGTALGDDLLVTLGRRMRTVCGQTAVVGRIGGDEFVVILPRMNKKEDDSFALLRRLLVAINEPVALHDINVSITASICVFRAIVTAHSV